MLSRSIKRRFWFAGKPSGRREDKQCLAAASASFNEYSMSLFDASRPDINPEANASPAPVAFIVLNDFSLAE